MKARLKDLRRPEDATNVILKGTILDANQNQRYFEVIEYHGGYNLELDGDAGGVAYDSEDEVNKVISKYLIDKDFCNKYRPYKPDIIKRSLYV